MSTDDSTTTLALLAGSGDRDALAELIRTTQSEVWRFVSQLGGPGPADDLTQETYLRMLGALPRFRGESSARWWLLTIARRVVVDHLRREAVRPRAAGMGEAALDAVAGSRGDHGSAYALRALIDALPPTQREALLLTRVMGYSYAEAALIAGCPVGTVRSRVARARADLVGALEGCAVGV